MATKIDIAKLDKKVTALSNALAKLGRGTDLKELLRIIRFPGWTTPAELTLSIAVVDSMQAQANQLAKLSGSLLKGAQQIAKAGAKAKAKG